MEDVAQDLGVKPETVLEMESRLSGHDVAFDGAADADDEEAGMAPAAYLADNSMEPARQLEKENMAADRRERLYSALETLDARARDVLSARWLGDSRLTLQELADRYGVSAERIRQVEKQALNRLRTAMNT